MKIRILIASLLVLSGCACAEPHKLSKDSDICAILQLTIDLPNLQQYFHVTESPNRKPLRMVINDTIDTECISLKKFSEPVVFKDKQSAITSRLPYLEAKQIEFTQHNNSAKVIFTYDIEGINGTVRLKKKGGVWVLHDSRIVEV